MFSLTQSFIPHPKKAIFLKHCFGACSKSRDWCCLNHLTASFRLDQRTVLAYWAGLWKTSMFQLILKRMKQSDAMPIWPIPFGLIWLQFGLLSICFGIALQLNQPEDVHLGAFYWCKWNKVICCKCITQHI